MLNVQRQIPDEKYQGGELNSRPTPKAFGAALPLQVEDCESWVFLSLQVTLGFSRFSQSAKFFLGDDLKRIAESLRCRSMTARMLCKPRIEIERRTDVVSARRTAKNIDPRHLKKYQGGELNSRPRAYESPALPLSYPGIKLFHFARCLSAIRPTPNAFGAALPRHPSGLAAELPWQFATKLAGAGSRVNGAGCLSTSPRSLLLLRLGNIGREIFFAAAHCRHKTDAVFLFDYAGPTFLIDMAPAGKFLGCAGLRIPLRRKKKKLHLFFYDPDLCDTLPFLIVKNTTPKRAKIGKLRRHVVMREPVLHEKQVAQCASVGFHRVQHHRVCGTGHGQ